MANLKDELDQYLLLQSDQKKTNFKIDMKMPSLKVPEIKNLFGKSQPQEANGWLQETRDSCCPKLVCISFHVNDFFFAAAIRKLMRFFFRYLTVKTAENFRLFNMSWNGHILYDTFNILHPGANIESEKICIIIFVG